MLKIIKSVDNNGFVYSPFVVIVLVVISLAFAVHFMEIEKLQIEGIQVEAQVNKAVLDMEELKSNTNTIALHLSYQAISTKENNTTEELREEIENKLNEYVSNHRPAEVSTIEGNYSISLEKLPNDYLLVKTSKAPKACIENQLISLCSNLSIERIVDRKWTN
ncbi:MAG: hypothetical protein JW778_02785 [Candidatus Altiarchaeota archaeon]|nr:hypothetical protein [Candidatus Altiarchaeota archaeon]